MQLLDELIHKTHAVTDRKGEHHITCPVCGKESTPRNPHCSFNGRGWHCFSCGAGGGLRDLAERLNVQGEYIAPLRQEAPRQPASWLQDAERLIEQYAAHSRSWSLWQAYKPLSRSTYDKMRLGVGVLPVSKCKHERLIVPIYDGTMVVGLRGRALGCDCGKWLAPGGTIIEMYPLYNEAAIVPGAAVTIFENPIDSLLYTERAGGAVGVATYSIAYWYERWTKALQAARPEMVIVQYDNDIPGMGGGRRRAELVRQWLERHDRVPEPAGIKLVNKLQRAGLNAVPFPWDEFPATIKDFGQLVASYA